MGSPGVVNHVDIVIEHHRDDFVYHATVDGQPAGHLAYRPDSKNLVWTAYSTVVRPEFEGKGVGSALVRALAEETGDADIEINPTCWFVADWLDRHPNYAPVSRTRR